MAVIFFNVLFIMIDLKWERSIIYRICIGIINRPEISRRYQFLSIRPASWKDYLSTHIFDVVICHGFNADNQIRYLPFSRGDTQDPASRSKAYSPISRGHFTYHPFVSFKATGLRILRMRKDTFFSTRGNMTLSSFMS